MSETTTKATHTAGRWKFSLSQDGDLITKAEVTDADCRRICTVSLRADQSEVEPNMRLMAAAPDLLAACTAILEELEDRYDGAPDSKTLWMTDHIYALRAAIGKARAV